MRSQAKLGEEIGEGVELVPTTGLVDKLRRTKDEGEIEAIAEAARLADEVFEWIAGTRASPAGPSARSRRRPRRGCASSAPSRRSPRSSPPGPNGALPHAEPGDREIGAAELVVVDMGAKLDGYCSDGTRTFATGDVGVRGTRGLRPRPQRPGGEPRRHPGRTSAGAEADAVSREPIEAAGHAEHYGHGLGHGVGLEVHEAPRLGKTSDDVLVAGDVVTVEPGIYVPGRFGVRIEDLVVVDDAGVRNLSTTPKELRVTRLSSTES